VWVRRSAIRPVPRFARVPATAVAAVEAMLSGTDDRTRSLARDAFDRFNTEQRALARYVLERLQRPLDEPALALGRMLVVAVFLAFQSVPGLRLRRSTEDEVSAADIALGADEELRRTDPMDALDSEDIVAIEQPALVAFVNEHIGRTLEKHAGTIDVDHVAVVFRAVLVEILTLSHAVEPPPGHSPTRGREPMA
jgi:hypothetical protein